MDHIAKLAISGLGSIANMQAADVYMLENATTAAPPAPPAAEDPCAWWLAQATRLNGETAYQFVAATLVFAFLAAWVRRSTNQKAILLGFGVESFLSLLHSVAITVSLRQWLTCLNPDFAPTRLSTFQNVFLILARLAQTGTGIAAGCGRNQKVGLAFTGSCICYFLVWFLFEFFGNGKSIMDLYENGTKDIINALARSVPGACAGIILAIQRAPASEEEVELP